MTFCREIPAFACYFGSYDIFYEIFNFFTPDFRTFDYLNSFAAGGVAGVLSWYATYPIDCAKTKLQASSSNKSMRLIIKEVINDGIKNDMLLKSTAMKTTLMRAFVCNGVTFGTVTIVLQFF